MKKMNSNRFAALILIILISSLSITCTKEGAVGPQGERGEQGTNGVAGDDGATIFSGATAPATDLGVPGDFYFNTVNSNFYGPKTAAGWGIPTNLKGATGASGATGAAGSRIWTGIDVPATAAGANGDFYFRSGTADFYGPKTAAGWGTPINLKGLKGEDGSRIFSGTTVPLTTLGKAGDFYFRTSTSDFYGPKTASGWGTPINLKGATGATGANGSTGPAGTPGSKILSGSSLPTSTIGVNGDFYIHTSTANLYGPKTAAGWGNPISLRGPAGPKTDVIYSNWMELDGYSSSELYGWLLFPELVKDPKLVDYAAIMVYAKEFDTDGSTVRGVYQLNFTSPIWGNYIQYNINISDGIIIISSDFESKLPLDKSHLFRYVVIPGNVSSWDTQSRIPQNYQQLKMKYSLPD